MCFIVCLGWHFGFAFSLWPADVYSENLWQELRAPDRGVEGFGGEGPRPMKGWGGEGPIVPQGTLLKMIATTLVVVSARGGYGYEF